jgi:hypothetical protein
MKASMTFVSAATLFVLACGGDSSPGSSSEDDASTSIDGGGGGYDAHDGAPGNDAGNDAAAVDATDAALQPDVGSGPTPCNLGPPLAKPIAGCNPVTPASTGDPHEDCVRRINQIRCECQHLPPLVRWVDGEACADAQAQYDYGTFPHACRGANLSQCPGDLQGFAQCEAPWWPSVDSTIDQALMDMWNEGPPPPNGDNHYAQMASTQWNEVACGFYAGSGSVTAVQNYSECAGPGGICYTDADCCPGTKCDVTQCK